MRRGSGNGARSRYSSTCKGPHTGAGLIRNLDVVMIAVPKWMRHQLYVQYCIDNLGISLPALIQLNSTSSFRDAVSKIKAGARRCIHLHLYMSSPLTLRKLI